jgi:hypothetical protein
LRGLIPALGVALLGAPGVALADTQNYTISSFDSVRVEAPVTLILTTGGGSSGRGEGPRATLERLRVEVSGRVLKISMVAATGGGRSAGPATLRFSTGDLRRVMLTGGGSVTINRMKGVSGDIVLGGNGDVTVQAVDVDRLTVMLAGGGRATLAGRAGVADLRVSGPGSIAADKLIARQSRLSSDGPGGIDVTTVVAADIRTSGTGDVTVLGKPACTVKNLGTGRVLCAGEGY